MEITNFLLSNTKKETIKRERGNKQNNKNKQKPEVLIPKPARR